MIISHSSDLIEKKYFSDLNWEIKYHKMYRTCLEEENYQYEKGLMQNDDAELENLNFCKVLQETLTKTDLSEV